MIIFLQVSVPSSVWDNYLHSLQHKLFVYARLLENRKAKSLSSKNNVTFNLSSIYKSPKDYFLNRTKLKLEVTSVLQEIDVVIIRLPSFLGLTVVEACKKQNIPYLVEVVGNVEDALSNYGSFIGRVFAKYVDKLTAKAVKEAKYAIYVTKDYLQECYPCSNTTEFASDVEIEAGDKVMLDKRLTKISRFKPLFFDVGTIGNIEVKYKGYEVLIKVIALLKKEGIILNYKIAGAGSQDYLSSLAIKYGVKDQLFFMGTLNRAQVFSYLSDIDVYIHPSFQEGLPRVVVEAMSCATPILASNIGGIPELLPKQFLHNPGDHIKLYNDIKKIISRTYNLKGMAIENWNKSLEYDRDLLISKRRSFFKKFYEESFIL